MRSSYSGSVIGPKMSTCTLPRIFMPAPWITRTLVIVLSVRTGLAFLWRPAIRLGAGTTHQQRAFTVAQAVGLAERLDGLFVVHDCEGARAVGTPQAAFETPGVEHAGEGVPDVRERVRFPGQRAGPADLDHRVRAPGQVLHLG